MFTYVVSKLANIVIGVAFGVVQLWLVTRYAPEPNVGYLVTALSIFAYFSFFDLGFSRPFYARIRAAFCGPSFSGADYNRELAVPLLLVPTGALVMLFTLLVYGAVMNASSVLLFIVFLSLAFGFNVGLNFYRPLLDAVDKFALFERLEVAKRILLLLAQLTIPIDSSLTLVAALMFAINITLFLLAYHFARRTYCVQAALNFMAMRGAIEVMRRDIRNAANFFIFTLSETLSNNIALLAAPFILSTVDVILLNLWFRLYRGITLISRAVVDINMHDAIGSYFQSEKVRARRRLLSATALSVLTVSVPFGIFIVFRAPLVEELSSGLVQLEPIYWILLGGLVFLNVIQHASGSFLLNIGVQFAFSRNAALCVLAGLIISTSTLSAQIETPAHMLTLFISIYAGGMVFYVGRTWALLR